MNDIVLMVQGYLLYPENYTKEQLKENYHNAVRAASAVCAAVRAASADWHAASYAVEAAKAAADAEEVIECIFIAQEMLNEYFKYTGENKQDYIDELEKRNA